MIELKSSNTVTSPPFNFLLKSETWSFSSLLSYKESMAFISLGFVLRSSIGIEGFVIVGCKG